MNGIRIVTLVMALAVTAVVGTAAAQESAEPAQTEEIREVAVLIEAAGLSEEAAARVAESVTEQIESAGGEVVDILFEQIAEDDIWIEPLGITVTLEFVVDGMSEPVSVTTASREYAVNAQRSTKVSSSGPGSRETVVEDNSIDVAGTIDMYDEDNTFLVTCWGSFTGAGEHLSEGVHVPRESDEEEPKPDREEVEEGTFVEFQASAVFHPNQTRVIACRGGQKLELTVGVDEND